MAGTWTVVFDWDCDGSTATAYWYVKADGSFTDSSGNAGTWTQAGKAIDMHYPVNQFDYIGKLHRQARRASGTIYHAVEGDMGCWKASR